MKNSAVKALCLSALLLGVQPAMADFTTVFNDPCTGDISCSGWGTGYSTPGDGSTGTPQYFGGDGAFSGPDIVGFEADFDILKMTVSQTGGNLVVTVQTRFVQNPQSPSVLYGDLMLATGGWHPFGIEPYADDNASNSGTIWNYVVQTGAGGTQNIYHNATLEKSDTAPHDPSLFRLDQYVRYGTGGTSAGTASVTINPVNNLANTNDNGDGTTNYDALGTDLTYTIPISALGLPLGSTEVALRWTMTCANDIIEAAVNLNVVPEPATLSLFLGGLAGLQLLRRLRHRAA